jgi:streptogramin lyase
MVAQNLPLGSWREHLSYTQARFVVNTGNRIYCATEQAIFYIDLSDNSIHRISKINGLSDVGISLMDYNASQNVMVVCYSNSNIDLLSGDAIVNLSDVERRTATGDKFIYDMCFNGRFAYLATGFGVIAVDLIKNEIKETYVIGTTGNEVPVYAITSDDTYLYACTDVGILRGEINNPQLNNFAEWQLVYADNISGLTFNKIRWMNGKLAVNFHSSAADSVVVIDASNFNTEQTLISGSSATRQLKTENNRFYVVNNPSVTEWDQSLQTIVRQIQSGPVFTNTDMYAVANGNSGSLYIADGNNGLVNFKDNNQVGFIIPNSPASARSSYLFHNGKTLYVTHGVNRWNDSYDTDGYSTFDGTEWKTWNKKTISSSPFDLGLMMDVQSIITEPGNPSHTFLGSRINGVFEFNDNAPVTLYNQTNSTLQPAFGNPGQVKIGGLAYDASGNLWVVNSGNNTCLNKRSSNGTWQAYNLQSSIPAGVNLFFGEVLCDSYGQVWLTHISNGLLVYDPEQQRSARISQESGGLPVNDVRCMVEDNEGQLWLGTSEGIAVIYSPGNATGSNTVKAQKILITIDGITQYLLDKEIVTAIAVDGANRKWIGTNGGGIFLLSADGTKQITNFNTQNSPLYSNTITSIAIQPETGEVFIGTDKGLISYVGDATKGSTSCQDVTVFPNPVKENYTGPIAIRGVTANGSVKITDVAGNVVYETKAKGGIATWDGNTFEGKRVYTGVYLVFATDEKGDNTCVTKLFLVN